MAEQQEQYPGQSKVQEALGHLSVVAESAETLELQELDQAYREQWSNPKPWSEALLGLRQKTAAKFPDVGLQLWPDFPPQLLCAARSSKTKQSRLGWAKALATAAAMAVGVVGFAWLVGVDQGRDVRAAMRAEREALNQNWAELYPTQDARINTLIEELSRRHPDEVVEAIQTD